MIRKILKASSYFFCFLSFTAFAQNDFISIDQKEIKTKAIHFDYLPHIKETILILALTKRRTSLNGCPIDFEKIGLGVRVGSISRGDCESTSKKYGEGIFIEAAFLIDPKKLPYLDTNGAIKLVGESPCFNSLKSQSCFNDSEYSLIKQKILDPNNIIFIPSKLIDKSITQLESFERKQYLVALNAHPSIKSELVSTPNIPDDLIQSLNKKEQDQFLYERTKSFYKKGVKPPPPRILKYQLKISP